MVRDEATRRRPRLRSWAATASVAVLALAAGGCTQIEDVMASIPLLNFLRESPAFDPYEMPRPAPPGAVPFATPSAPGAYASLPAYPEVQPTEVSLQAFAAAVRNPVPMTDGAIEAGKLRYEQYCAVCHGPVGKGNGPVIGQGKFPFAPDLTIPTTVQRPDGYLYAITVAGRGLMPSYRRIPDMERWYIVNYIRYLQGQGGQPPATAAPQPAQPRPAAGTAQAPEEN